MGKRILYMDSSPHEMLFFDYVIFLPASSLYSCNEDNKTKQIYKN